MPPSTVSWICVDASIVVPLIPLAPAGKLGLAAAYDAHHVAHTLALAERFGVEFMCGSAIRLWGPVTRRGRSQRIKGLDQIK